MLNDNIAEGKWKELKGRIQSAWGKLTSDELDTAKGDALVIAGLVQKKYGIAEEAARRKVNDLFAGTSQAGSQR